MTTHYRRRTPVAVRPPPLISRPRRRFARIPESWTGEDALLVVAFLERLIHAIWRAHGSSMAPILAAGRHNPGYPAPPTPLELDINPWDDDDVPL